jgi:hypothetical protein
VRMISASLVNTVTPSGAAVTERGCVDGLCVV